MPARLLKPIRAGCVRCLVAGLVGSLVLRAVLAVYVLSVAVLTIAVLAVYVLAVAVLSVYVLSIAVLIAVSAIRRIVLCIRVSCHIFLHSGGTKTAAALLYLLTAGLVFEIRKKICTARSVKLSENFSKKFLLSVPLFIAF